MPSQSVAAGWPQDSAPALSLDQARRLQLHAQGLLSRPRRRARPADLVGAVERMRLLQIDTIQVVARSPYLVLFSRLGDFPLQWLDHALADGHLAEAWAHEACFVPAADFPWHEAWRPCREHHWAHRHARRMLHEHPAEMHALLEQVAREGPVRSSDFARQDRGAGGWWAWKPEKRWLEAWFALGELMVLRRENFARVYDLAANVRTRLDPPPAVAPAGIDRAAARRRFIVDTVRALGVVPARWIADYYRLRPQVTDREMQPLLADDGIFAVQVAGWSEPGYVHAEHAGALQRVRAGRLRATHTAVLSPFDPLVWDRQRLRGMFGFDYALECYLPASKRQHGYFVLPILHRGALVGRLDAKAHRAHGEFEIRALFLEPGVRRDAALADALAVALLHLADWHGTAAVRLGRTVRPADFAALLRASLVACRVTRSGAAPQRRRRNGAA
ncbi:MAG: winged helix DNA-binding domain-containing protein [Xanthomonadaceae bacterium]|nr:winged helix DNA-binding domain-containing protein [Xanthomonadaceae bacterium]MDE1964651.1 YcaQ family DNA glycosylase [Xanthomonadaceae bacterium]